MFQPCPPLSQARTLPADLGPAERASDAPAGICRAYINPRRISSSHFFKIACRRRSCASSVMHGSSTVTLADPFFSPKSTVYSLRRYDFPSICTIDFSSKAIHLLRSAYGPPGLSYALLRLSAAGAILAAERWCSLWIKM